MVQWPVFRLPVPARGVAGAWPGDARPVWPQVCQGGGLVKTCAYLGAPYHARLDMQRLDSKPSSSRAAGPAFKSRRRSPPFFLNQPSNVVVKTGFQSRTMALGWLWWRAPWSPRLFAWQAWHLARSSVISPSVALGGYGYMT